MSTLRLEPDGGGGFLIEAADLGPMLRIDPAEVPALMRSGRITSRVERGEGEDAGRFRVTFRHGGTRLRLTLADTGEVLSVTRLQAAPPG